MPKSKLLKEDLDLQLKLQYETFPFPPPRLSSPAIYRSFTRKQIQTLFFYADKPLGTDFRLLEAGCGIGSFLLRIAELFPEMSIVGIDRSTASLEKARSRAQEMNLKNITFFEANLLDSDTLSPLISSGPFDGICCNGVLHHTSQPEKALANLRNILDDQGSMYLGLYNSMERFEVRCFQQMINRMIPDRTDFQQRLNLCRKLLKSLNPESRLGRYFDYANQEQRYADDNYLIDLLLNVQEQYIHIPEIFNYLDYAGLNFICFKGEKKFSLLNLDNPELIDAVRSKSRMDQYTIMDIYSQIGHQSREFRFTVEPENKVKPLITDKNYNTIKYEFSPFFPVNVKDAYKTIGNVFLQDSEVQFIAALQNGFSVDQAVRHSGLSTAFAVKLLRKLHDHYIIKCRN